MKYDFIEPRCALRVTRHQIVQSLTHKHHPVVINYIMAIMGKYEFNISYRYNYDDDYVTIFLINFLLLLHFYIYSYNTYSNEVGYGSPYGYSTSVTSQQNMGYDISADYVDSTTTYEPRSTIIDSDFIGGHSKCIYVKFIIIFFMRKLFI